MNKRQNRFVIVDAMAIAYKAYFAFINRPLVSSKGEPTSAIYGFMTQLIKIIEDTKPKYLAIATDSKEKTFRHEIYEGYKSSREVMPEDMIPQIKRMYEIIEALNVPLFIMPGYEADDIIGTVLKKTEELGIESFAITPDKDYIQLITDKSKIIKPGKTADDVMIIDKEKAIHDMGFEPKYMVDYLALVGDSSDDIPGVAGIGPKTATPLIAQYGTIEKIYDNIENIKSDSVKRKLLDSKDNAFLSKTLATIKTDVPIDFNLEDTLFIKPDLEKINNILKDLDLKSITQKFNKLFGSEDETAADDETENYKFDPSNVDYKLVSTEKEAEELVKLLLDSELFVFDTETNSLNVFDVKLAGASFTIEEGKAFFVPINPFVESDSLFQRDLSDRIDIYKFVDIFKPVFENKKVKKVCQNGKYDIAVLRTNGIDVNNFYFDTMLASYILDPDQRHGMDALADTYLDYTPIPISELIGKDKNPDLIFDVEIDKLKDYACEDSDITYRLYKIFDKELKEKKQDKIAYEVEFPLVPVLEDMERTGVNLDIKALQKFSKELRIAMDSYTSRIFEIAGESFNINSPKQLQYILFDKLGLTPTKKTKTGFSTDAGSLEALKGQNEIIDYLLEYRQATKLKSTYADALPKLVNPRTKRLHTSFNQTVASTGRLSSLNPNLQNIPIRTELGKKIRAAFTARNKDYIILSSDYSQIELRIMASISGDETLIEAFEKGEDIHRSTAALVFGVNPDDVTPDMRRKAKEVNFGILYGIGAFGLANRLGLPRNEAQNIIDTYFEKFDKVKAFIEDSINKAKEHGFAETLLGRRRYLRNINSKNRAVRQFEERVAVNMPIQGTAADMIKLAMIKVFDEFNKASINSKMILQVHDELVFDVHKNELETVKPIIKKSMEEALPLSIPISVDMGTGNNWLEAH
ncbi:MAG: DNA polymerase I [Chlorobi bacterium]|nr:DNA polymerase I [Chlorobiota bacterium]